MLNQATAVLVTFATLTAADFYTVRLLAILRQRLPIAGPPRAGKVQSGYFIRRRVVTVVNGALSIFSFRIGNRSVRG